MGTCEVEAFLTHLAVAGKVSASTQNQAKSALLFLYREVLEVELPWLDNLEQAKAPTRLPVVLTQTEVQAMLSRLQDTVQELLRQVDIAITMIYTPVLNKGGRGVKSSLDVL